MGNRDLSMEAYKASELLNVLLYHIKLPYSPSQPQNAPLPAGNPQSQGSNNDEQNAAMTLGMLQAGGLGSTLPAGSGSNAASPGGPWDKGGLYGNFGVNNEQFNPGLFGAANPASPFGSGLFSGPMGMGNLDQGMNLDWEAWDQYMQPSNLSLDPAASLWPNNSPNNNLFAQTSSPDTTGDSSFGLPSTGSGFYPQNIASVMSASTSDVKSEGSQQMPNLSANSTTNVSNESSAGEVFMGVQSPQPGGVPSWKWTIMGEQKK
jgi:hypothetical protein